MNGEVYIYLSYKQDYDKANGVGFFAKKDKVKFFKEIAKDNELFLSVEEIFDYTEDNNGDL